MVQARLIGANHYDDGEPLEEGDIVELTEEQYEAFEFKFERLDDEDIDVDEDEVVDQTPDDTEEGEDEVDVDDELVDVLDGTVSDVEEAVQSGDYDDRLTELEEAEREGDERTGVLDAIADRRQEV